MVLYWCLSALVCCSFLSAGCDVSTWQQHRPIENPSDAPPEADGGSDIPIVWRGRLSQNFAGVTIPFAFRAAAISPASEVAHVWVKVPGERAYVLNVGAPMLGGFPPGCLLYPYWTLDAPTSINPKPLYEIIFYPFEPDAVIPLTRGPYSRYVLNNKIVQDPNNVGSSQLATTAYTFCVDGRKRVGIAISNSSGATIYPALLWNNSNKFDPDNNYSSFGGGVNVNGVSWQDPAIDVPSGATRFIDATVPPGATGLILWNSILQDFFDSATPGNIISVGIVIATLQDS